MAAIPSSGSPGECAPRPGNARGPPSSRWYRDPPSFSGLPKADPGHWWASFFFGKSTLPFMATVLESPEHSEPPQAPGSLITCGSALAGRKQPRSPTAAGPPP
ncbi:pancreatic progenitor cell differentiation and proliferation factor [Tupaia chinensis]|uniref:Pancreatic progenitor cell differentiation and proliferation factor n=1 Tax=Tupaia chinensis TaxID=246437 RepID=L8Y8D0_TUPCH|nr:pancreatic progenitor cell differentiation and proliferation factor [Tupaia chinensis]ELV11339.1 Pancreatic progenitor cell differentiation and proliferation factor [Tupaia chinensis]